MCTFCGAKMAVPSSQETKLQKSRVRDIYSEMKPLWWTMLLLLLAPIQRGKSGKIISSWLSISGLMTLGICALNWWLVYYVFPVQMKALKDSESFPDEVFASLFVLGLNSHVLVPLTSWPFGKKLAVYLNEWTEFQELYAKVCGRQLELHLYEKSRVFAVLCWSFVPLTVVEFIALSEAPAWHSCAYFLGGTHTVAVVCTWHCNCLALGGAAEKMAEDFAIGLTTPRPLTAHLREYRKLWNSLQKLTVTLSYAQSATILQAALFLMSLNLITAFGLLGAVVAGETFHRIFVMLALASAGHFQILFIASSGYYCAKKVNLFLKDMAARPACIRIIGYLDVDKEMYVKIMAALARNFLVLLQFAYTGAKASIRPTETSHDDFYDFLR